MDKYSHPFIDALMKDPNNKTCFDCGIPQPKWASVNNAVFVCLNCAGVHRGLGVHISFIRSLTMDNWDEKQIRFLRNGGNKRLREFLEEYNIPKCTDLELKYKLVAVDYYRQSLRSEVLGDKEFFLEKPDIINGLERIEEGYRQEKVIDNNNYISSESISSAKSDGSTSNSKKNGFFNKVGSFFQKTADELGTKIKEIKIAEKLDKTATFFDNKTKQVIKSQFVQNIVDKTKKVFKNKNAKEINNEPHLEKPKEMSHIGNEFQFESQNTNTKDNTGNQNIEDFFTNNNKDKFEPIPINNTQNNSSIPTGTANLIDYPTFSEINYQNKNNNPFFNM